MPTDGHSGRRRAVAVALLACLGSVAASCARPAAVASALVPAASIAGVRAFSLTDGALPVYVATTSGLYRSASPDLTWWTRQNTLPDIYDLSPNPTQPDTLVFTRQSGTAQPTDGTYRSTDGGRTATRVSLCGFGSLVRGVSDPNTFYGLTGTSLPCQLPYDNINAIAASTDGGLTWTSTLTSTYTTESDGYFTAVTVDPTDAAHALASLDRAGESGVLETRDSGRTWHILESPLGSYISPGALAIDPVQPQSLWASWPIGAGAAELDHSSDGGRTWHNSGAFPYSQYVSVIQSDPLSGRTYVSVSATPGQSVIRPTMIYGLATGERFVPLLTVRAPDYLTVPFAVTRNGYLLAVGPNDNAPLLVRPLIAAGAWPVDARFARLYAALPTTRLLGQPLSPPTVCAGVPCQYFVKGALAVSGTQPPLVVPLVPRLIGARLALPVGAGSSTLTYRTLYALHTRRTPLPAGFHGGTLAVAGGTFVPYSHTLAAASGYVVPPYFWRYLTDARYAPDGWRWDIGLPLTQAVAATVTKGQLGVRQIVVQAFEDAVLTYDPKNATGWHVERANVGADFATAFPQAVR